GRGLLALLPAKDDEAVVGALHGETFVVAYAREECEVRLTPLIAPKEDRVLFDVEEDRHPVGVLEVLDDLGKTHFLPGARALPSRGVRVRRHGRALDREGRRRPRRFELVDREAAALQIGERAL